MSGAGLLRQVVAFLGVGVIAAITHYGTLIALVETGAMAVIPATLVGYVVGGLVSYALNRL
ncbi:MAG: GtrA family protein, partial [Methylobacterium sp.]|nr:GtrA family protein [Methylobacterium sp.]